MAAGRPANASVHTGAGATLCTEQYKLEKQMAALNPFAMRKEIRRLENEFWSHRERLYAMEVEEALALAGASSLRSEAPARATKPTTKNKAAMVSQL